MPLDESRESIKQGAPAIVSDVPENGRGQASQLDTQPILTVQHGVSTGDGKTGQEDDDHNHVHEPRLRDMPLRLVNLPRILLLALIRLYQATLSRTLPQNTCRFYPTCSHYGYQAIYKYGFIKGGLMAAWRVLRCNPFNPGGIDPVP